MPRTCREAAVEVKEGRLRLPVSNTGTDQSTGRGREEEEEERKGERLISLSPFPSAKQSWRLFSCTCRGACCGEGELVQEAL